MTRYLLHGMQGLGDNLHQRAIVREYMRRGDVWLETTWPAVYHDFAADGLRFLRKPTAFRTQRKNADRESALFTETAPPASTAVEVTLSYHPDSVRAAGGSVLAAMAAGAGVPSARNFSLPIPHKWNQTAIDWLLDQGWDGIKPVLVYRPLVERTEYPIGRTRNPDAIAYADLFAVAREGFFVVAVADLVPGEEWIVSQPIHADVVAYEGELEFEHLAGLFDIAMLVFCSPGFAVILAQALGTPVICVFGNYESSRSFSSRGTLAIEPITPCNCWQVEGCGCSKEIDVAAAGERIRRARRNLLCL